MVAALFKALLTNSALHRNRVSLRAVGADKGIPQAVIPVRVKIRREELVALFFIVKVMLDDAAVIPAAGCIQAHLEVAVVHIHLMEAELQIGIDRETAWSFIIIAKGDIPDLHRIVHGHKKSLSCINAAIVAVIFHIAQAVPAGVMLLRLAHRLPGDGPVITGILIPQIDIMPGPVHRNAVGAKAGNAVILGAFIEQIAPGCVVENPVHVPGADVIGPGHRQIHPVDHIFSTFVVKMAVLHG